MIEPPKTSEIPHGRQIVRMMGVRRFLQCRCDIANLFMPLPIPLGVSRCGLCSVNRPPK